MKDIKPTIAKNLSFFRKQSGLTQAELAEKLNYSDKAVSRWEHGDTLPDINVLYQLCDFYGIDMTYIVLVMPALIFAMYAQSKVNTTLVTLSPVLPLSQ